MDPKELLIKVTDILHDLKIPYAVTGGFAVTIWGVPRYTADIDIIIELVDKNIKPLAKQLLAIDKEVYADEGMMKEALLYHGEFNFIHPQTGLKVDFFVQDDQPYNKLKFKRAVLRDNYGRGISFISPEDLILGKLRWSKESGSEKQQEDIKNVLRNNKLKLDMDYIRGWAEKHDTIDKLEQLIEQVKLEK